MIHLATRSELETVTDQWVALIEHGRKHGLHLLPESNRQRARQRLAAALHEDRLLVATPQQADEPVGFVFVVIEQGIFETDRQRGVIPALYVDPEYRGEGIGSALLEAAENRLVELGVETAVVEPMAAAVQAKSFYRQQGFRPHRMALEKDLSDPSRKQ